MIVRRRRKGAEGWRFRDLQRALSLAPPPLVQPNIPLGEPNVMRLKVAAWVAIVIALIVIGAVGYGFVLLLQWARSSGHV